MNVTIIMLIALPLMQRWNNGISVNSNQLKCVCRKVMEKSFSRELIDEYLKVIHLMWKFIFEERGAVWTLHL